MGGKLDTRAIGLDGGLHFIRWLTGEENLHYGFWDGLQVNAGNLAAAQNAYTDLLFSYLPKGKLRILDIGGGAGETARKLVALGHAVQIVVPSALFAARCRENAPGAQVHQCKFEDFQTDDRFDLCLFSESFQYIPLKTNLSGALDLLDPGGEILLADCFRTPAFKGTAAGAVVGGGHPLVEFEKELARQPLEVLARRDITASVAPSIDLEQGLFNVLGHVAGQLDGALAESRAKSHWFLHRLINTFLPKRRREKLAVRLMEKTRTSDAFCTFNSYQIVRLGQTK